MSLLHVLCGKALNKKAPHYVFLIQKDIEAIECEST